MASLSSLIIPVIGEFPASNMSFFPAPHARFIASEISGFASVQYALQEEKFKIILSISSFTQAPSTALRMAFAVEMQFIALSEFTLKEMQRTPSVVSILILGGIVPYYTSQWFFAHPYTAVKPWECSPFHPYFDTFPGSESGLLVRQYRCYSGCGRTSFRRSYLRT